MTNKEEFKKNLSEFALGLRDYLTYGDGEWTVKGFIDIYKNIYTISSDTKIVSKILEIHLFPKIIEFGKKYGYKIVLTDHQNYYPDISFVKDDDRSVMFAVDLKTTYRDHNFLGHINGFTLGSHGSYFQNREGKKNIQFPYSKYSGHFCLGIIYSRESYDLYDETEVYEVKELEEGYIKDENYKYGKVKKLSELKSITSVIKDVEFFVAEKWQIASDYQGSSNTANIGSITCIEDLKQGKGVFSDLGEEIFDEYWMNYGKLIMIKDGKSRKITLLKDYLEFVGKKELLEKIKSKTTKKKAKKI
ncbi:MAG: type II restriction endonuclease [Candidatus Kapaibacterium sp.]